MSAADCERWENRLLDLAYEELDEPDEREVRAHLDGCEHCRAALEKLSRGRALSRKLPQAEPPPEVLSAVLRAARDKALEVQAARAEAARAHAQPAPVEVEAPPPRGIGAWLVGLLLSPQFAMATLLLLTVGVGLWWFPGAPGDRAATPPLVSEPTSGVTPGALEPAEPLRFDVNPRTGRVAARGDETAPVEPRPDRPDRRVHLTTPAEAEGELHEEEIASAVAMVDPGATAGAVVEGALPSTTSAPPSGLGATVAPVPAATERIADEGPAPAAPASDELEGPSPDGATLMASALLGQARELARAGRDREAVSQYEAMLSRYPTSSEAPQAMLEVAEVYRRLGLTTRARRWLERAATSPSVATAARRELVRLDAAEAAAIEPPHAAAAEAASSPE